jgi:transketolase
MSEAVSASHLTPDLFGKLEMKATRDGYGDGLLEIGELDEDVVVLTGDLAESTRAQKFGDKWPDRFFEVGVAEQNMMGIAAGLALAGKTPFVSSYATFSPGRNWDQLRVSVAYSQANVKVAGAHSGLSVGPDGATHQAMEDISIVRSLPNMTVVVPCDYLEAKKATVALGKMQGPAYFRFGREKTSLFTTADTPFVVGRAEILCEGKDVALIACGALVYEALKAAEELSSDGISAMVVNNHTVKPLDVRTISHMAAETGAVVTAEEHQVMGGMGSAVAECLAQHCPVPLEMVGMPDHFGESGKPEELLSKWGMSSKEIVLKAKHAIVRKR